MLDTSYIPEPIILNIPDIIVEGTVIKRKAELFTMIYNLKHKTLTLSWEISHYASNDGDYGTYLGNIVPNRFRETVADNTTFVDPQTGAFIYPEVEGFVDVPYIGQFDFFHKIATYQPIIVNDLIRQYGQQTNWTT